MTRRIDIVLPELNERDATGEHSLRLRDLLTDMGGDVRFVAERPSAVTAVSLLKKWTADADITILQHSIGSLAAEAVIRREVPVVVNYHNVTPFEFIEPWEPDLIRGLRWGRDQLASLAPHTRLAIADSAFNAHELVATGFDDVVVAPILFDPAGLFAGGAVEPAVSGGPVWLFVGRLVPNKAQHDLISSFAAFRATRPDARLVLVGAEATSEYRRALDRLCVALGMEDAVIFAGSISGGELSGWYDRADVFVCLSDHEGFCVPLLEALYHGLPIVAYAAAAVPETLAGAGLVIGEKRPATVAAAAERVLVDTDLRAHLRHRGATRLEELALNRTRETFREVIERRLGVGAP